MSKYEVQRLVEINPIADPASAPSGAEYEVRAGYAIRPPITPGDELFEQLLLGVNETSIAKHFGTTEEATYITFRAEDASGRNFLKPDTYGKGNPDFAASKEQSFFTGLVHALNLMEEGDIGHMAGMLYPKAAEARPDGVNICRARDY